MLLLRWLWIGNGNDGEIPPIAVFWTLRVLMFALSFVLEDWAIHELVQSPRHRIVAVLLVASSYVTWTYQTHTFSNSIETLAVAWSLVVIERIVGDKVREYNPLVILNLIIFTAAILSLCLCYPRVSRDVWDIQSHHFPSILANSWSSFDTAFHEEV